MKVEAVSQKEVKTKFGVKQTYSIKADDGQWYNFGFNDPSLNKGDEVEFDFENTKYGNNVKFETVKIKSYGAVAGKSEPLTTAPRRAPFPRAGVGSAAPYQKVFPIPVTHGDRSIVRQNALTNARELVVASSISSPKTQDQIEELARFVVKVAHIFEEYSAGDVERREAEKGK